MKRLLFCILLMCVITLNLKAEQLVDLTTVEELKLAYGKDFNVYVPSDSPFYFMGHLTKDNLLQACADNGYLCTDRDGIIEINQSHAKQPTILPSEVQQVKPIAQRAKSTKNKPESFSGLQNVSVAAGKLVYPENDELESELISAQFIKPTIYIYSHTNHDRKVSLFDELLTSLSPFSLNKKLGLPIDLLFNNKNIADFFDSRTDSFYFSKTFISCVTGDFCEVTNESRYEYDETVRTQISESTSKRFDIVTQGFKIRFRAQAIDLNVSFCEDRYNCIKFDQVSERKIGECYELFFKSDIKLNARYIFSETKNTKINNLGFVICEK